MTPALKRIALTPGEPAGIGPELAVSFAQRPTPYQWVAIADPELLLARAQQLSLPLTLREFDPNNQNPQANQAGELYFSPVKLAKKSIPGQLDASNAAYVLKTLKTANDGCLSGLFDAIVTGPVQKSIINDAGIPFSGHTEFFADSSHTSRVVMMLATEGLRVALATTHLPLKDVSDAITFEGLVTTLKILHQDCQIKFGLRAPRIAICGLNPHAGEGGHLGKEEIETITPAIEHCRRLGMTLTAPLPADTLFTPYHLDKADAVLAMYHDQGLPVLKYKGFNRAVNITLGLPYIRTSVDHGTALDLAGTGQAKIDSLCVAFQYAYDMALQQK